MAAENVDGGLGFVATLDIKDFNVSADTMERKIRNVSDTVVSESAQMDDAIHSFAKNASSYIINMLVAGGMMGLVKSIVQTRGQFQQLEIAFETMLGSASKSKQLMDQMTETAAKTPFDLAGVAAGAKQLMAYGLAADKVNDTLVKLGNIAAGLSIPLSDIVYLYGTTMVQGRLYTQDVRQFTGRGIPLVKELAAAYGVTTEKIQQMVTEGKIGFADVEKVLNKMTSAGGQFYNLMEKQSASLTGMISNLEDAWDVSLNKIGERNQDTFAAAISGATTVVENLDTIVNVLKAVAIGYGSYKAAVILNNLALKGSTGIEFIDNAAKEAKIAIMKAEEIVTGKVAERTERMRAAQEANTAALERQITAEQKDALVKGLRVSAIDGLLTSQQKEYLSNLGLTAESENYEKVAMGVMSAEQKLALSKMDLTTSSAAYRMALEKEVAMQATQSAARQASSQATLEEMRTEVKAAAQRLESAKMAALNARQRVAAAREALAHAQEEGNATAIATAQKRLEGAVENEALARKAALNSLTDFSTKRKKLEAEASAQAAMASKADAQAKQGQTIATTGTTVATGRLTLALKTLWASIRNNPIGWLLTIVGMAASAFTMFRNKTKEADDFMGQFQETTQKETSELKTLMAILRHTESGTTANKKAIEKINAICKDYNVELLKENASLEDQKTKYDELTAAINSNAAAKIRAKNIEKIQAQQDTDIDKEFEKLFKQSDHLRRYANTDEVDDMGGYLVEVFDVKSIQNMNGTVKDFIRETMRSAAEELKTLSGEEFDEAAQVAFQNIMTAIQDATEASDIDMDAFEPILRSTFDSVVRIAQEAVPKINESIKASAAFEAALKPNNDEDTIVDYTKKSFTELDEIIKSTVKSIDEINKKEVKTEADTSEIERLNDVLMQANNALTSKTEGLNTESDISDRIKQLKDERANVEINSDRYKQLSAEIQQLTERLPKNADKDPVELERQRKERLLSLQRETEKARIEIMEEGYEKRKAMLELQHRMTLEAIEKEKREYAKNKKDNGQGALTDQEEGYFSSRVDSENRAYEKAQAKLFDNEISYKKEQYELYWKWVKNMGEDVANKHFATLLKNGASYKDYIEREISRLTTKQDNGEGLTEAESNHLIALKIQYDDITGAKSAIDSFREALANATDNAATLAQKILNVADLKQQLENGETGLNDDEKAQMYLLVTEKETELNRELQDTLVNDYKGYKTRYQEITQQYELLKNKAIEQGNTELLNTIKRAEQKALSALNQEMLEADEQWQQLFEKADLDTLREIDKLIEQITTSGKLLDYDLTDEDIKGVVAALRQLRNQVAEDNPFKRLSAAIKQFNEDATHSSLMGIVDAAQNLADIFMSITQNLQACVDAIGNETASKAMEGLVDVMGNLQASLQGAQAGGQLGGQWGAVVGAIIGGAVDLIPKIIKWTNKKNIEAIEELQAHIQQLTAEYDKLGQAAEHAFATDKADLVNQQIQVLENKISDLNDMIDEDADQSGGGDSSRRAEWQSQIDSYEAQIEELKKYSIIDAIMGTDVENAISQFANAYANAWAVGGTAGAYTSANIIQNIIKTAVLEHLKMLIQPKVTELMEYLTEAMDDGVISDSEQVNIDEYLADINEITNGYMAQTQRWLMDMTAAVDDFAEAYVSAWEEGNTAAGKSGDVVKKIIRQQIIEGLRNILQPGVQNFMEMMRDMMADGIISDIEQAALDEAQEQLERDADEYITPWAQWLGEQDPDSLSGAVRAMSEDTGSVVAGRLNAVIINQSSQQDLLRDMLIVHQTIATNTGNNANYAYQILRVIERMETKYNTLLSQGLGG